MKNNNLIQWLFVIILICIPFIYTAMIWNQLPEQVALHFGVDGKPDRYGAKGGLLLPVILLMAVSLGVYLLMKNIDKFDPKRAKQMSKETFNKFGLLIVFFMSGLSTYIVHSALTEETGNFLFVILGLFFAALGNLMHSVKPNYFVGIRVPWTLENEDNWRKTHQLASKIWFIGGLLMAATALFLPAGLSFYVFLVMIVVMGFIPVIFSYLEFKKMS
jgi:uncharacterized membrane protein